MCLPLLVASSIRGELDTYRIDYRDGQRARVLPGPDDQASARTRLRFAADPQLQPWTKHNISSERLTGFGGFMASRSSIMDCRRERE